MSRPFIYNTCEINTVIIMFLLTLAWYIMDYISPDKPLFLTVD